MGKELAHNLLRVAARQNRGADRTCKPMPATKGAEFPGSYAGKGRNRKTRAAIERKWGRWKCKDRRRSYTSASSEWRGEKGWGGKNEVVEPIGGKVRRAQ